MRYAFFTLISLVFLAMTSTDVRREVKLRNIELAQGSNYFPVSDANGVLQYQLLNLNTMNVNLSAIGYTPTATGNANNNNEIVSDPNGDVYAIDDGGEAILLRNATSGKNIKVYDEAVGLTTNLAGLKFVGDAVTATVNSDTVTVEIGGSTTGLQSSVLTIGTFEIDIHYRGEIPTLTQESAGYYTISIGVNCEPKSFMAQWTSADVDNSNGLRIDVLDNASRKLWFQEQLYRQSDGQKITGTALAAITPRQRIITFNNIITQTYSSVNSNFRMLATFVNFAS